MGLDNLKSVFQNTKKFESTKPKTTQEPSKVVENRTLPVSPDVKPFGTVDLGAMSSEFAIKQSPQRVDFIDNSNAQGFTPNADNVEESMYAFDSSRFGIDVEPQNINFFKDENAIGFVPNAIDKDKSFYIGGTSMFDDIDKFGPSPEKTTSELNSFLLSDLTAMDIGNPNTFTQTDLASMDIGNPNSFAQTDLTTMDIGDPNSFVQTDLTTMDIGDTNLFLQSDVTTNLQEPNEFPQSDVTTNLQEPNAFPQSDVTTNTQEPEDFSQSDVTINAQDSSEFVQSDVTTNLQEPNEFAQSDVTVNAQDPTEFVQTDVTVNAQDSTEFIQTDVTSNLEEPNEFLQSDLTLESSNYSIEIEPQEVDFLENTHAVGFTANIGDLQSLYEFASTNINTSIFRIESEPQSVNFFGDTHALGFTAGLSEGSDSLYVGDTSIFRIESEPQEVNFSDIENIYHLGFKANREHQDPTNYIGSVGTEYTNPGIFGTLAGGVNYIEDTHATGFTLNQFHKAPTLFTGNNDDGTYTNTGLIGTLDSVDFFDNTGATGFTISDQESNPFTTQFQGIDETAGTFTKPASATTWDTHDLELIFTNQISEGVNFLDEDKVHSNGFTPSLTELSDSQFIGVDEDTPDFSNTGNYYDSIHTRNVISDSVFGPVDFMSGVTSYYTTLESPIPGFTNEFGLGEESLPGYNTEAGELGISRFFRTQDGTGFQTGLEDIYLGTGTHTMWGKSLTLTDQMDTGLSFLNKSSIYGDDPSTTDVEETDFALPYAQGFTPNLTSGDYTNSQFEGVDEEAGTYTPRTTYQGGYAINTDNIDLSVDVPENGELFNPAEDLGQFGTSNVGLGLFPSKTVRLQGGQEVEFTHNQYSVLYNNNQTVKDTKFTNGAKMSLKNDGSGDHPSQGPGGLLFGFSRGNEPYVVSEINDAWYGSRLGSINASVKDTKRLGEFIVSNQGLAFITKENVLASGLGWDWLGDMLGVGNPYTPLFYDPTSLVSGIPIGPVNIRTRRDEGLFGFLASLTGFDIFKSIGETYPGSEGQYFHKFRDNMEEASGDRVDTYRHGDVLHTEMKAQNMQKSMDVGSSLFAANSRLDFNNKLYNDYVNGIAKHPTSKGEKIDKSDLRFDPFTVMDTNVVGHNSDGTTKTYHDVTAASNIKEQLAIVEKQQHGMPLYFRDLRDGRVVTFRAYISGLNESLSPNWSSETYVGRSEPVYIYSGGEREIGFTLKLAAQSDIELTAIYEKLNRLTSMTYPEYKSVSKNKIKLQDETGKLTGKEFTLDIGTIGAKARMKPPMLKFRLGELYGVEGKEVIGFIKSLSYNFPDESPWETEKGKRVPKFVDVELGYQIIHDEVPSLSFAQYQEDGTQHAFYGISKEGGAPFSSNT